MYRTLIMKIFDSHFHLDDGVFDQDLDMVLQRATDSGVAAVLIAGVNQESSMRALKLAQLHANVYASVGVHPHDAKGCNEDIINELKALASDPKARAWGVEGSSLAKAGAAPMASAAWKRTIESASPARALSLGRNSE